ncbi:TonB-dependent receptor [Sphingobacterium deserti]|uniref:TonB-dependent receptor n=1 Tax=Sphingobacterium deserti TaxID=1229276 RepID=UPI0023A96F0B|nr:TonB-dependent receptor [Sphingobacterium deserti]
MIGQSRNLLSGYVLDSLRRPLENAQVTLHPDNKIMQTDTAGFFSFTDLYSGTYKLEVRRVGFAPSMHAIALEDIDSLITIHLRADARQIDTVLVNGKVAAVDNLVRVESSAMPVKIITRREIELMGSRRLDEVMKEQTGVAVVNDVAGGSRAVGVQVQGFSSNYVMVLIDGQPMMGRNNGNFDLSRISVTNIERIEIIKGATSCLYGSDALGGAINIVTRHGAVTPQAQASILYGSRNIVDATLEAETPFAHQRGSVVVSGNYYRTDGFNTDRQFLDNESTTFPPYENYSFQGRGRYRVSKKGTFGLTSRYAARKSTMINAWSEDLRIEDKQEDQELSLAASYDHSFSSALRSMSRYYYTRFHTQMDASWLQQEILAGAESFGQQAHRLEQQFAYTPMQALKFTGGLGAGLERMDEQSLDERRSLNTAFAFLQTEWKATERLLSTLGLRYDYSNAYNGRLSPSLGLQYQLHSSLLLKAGVGAGFKAPDYKMRYQVFFNPAANYLVVGSDRAKQIIEAMDASGEISFKNTYMLNILDNNLKAEKSLSNNIGLAWSPSPKLQLDASLFYHRINDQINTVVVANGTTITSIFSYRNLPKAVNKGFEVSATYQASRSLQLSAGYQYLIAKDLAMLDSIRSGRYPYNQYNNAATGEYRESRESDYWGIEDRSRHMLNLKALYTYQPWDINLNLRANIRGRYPFQDINGNQFIDNADAFVPWHTLLNVTLEKRIFDQRMTIRLVGDNLLNFTNRNMLGQPGRVVLAGLSYRWMKD